MTTKEAISYCSSADCPYDSCELHRNRIKNSKSYSTARNYENDCRKYLNWLAYNDYRRYIELKDVHERRCCYENQC